jgi:hypothetical protein
VLLSKLYKQCLGGLKAVKNYSQSFVVALSLSNELLVSDFNDAPIAALIKINPFHPLCKADNE